MIIVPFLVAWIGALALTNRGRHPSFPPANWCSVDSSPTPSTWSTSWFGLWRTGMSAVGITGGPIYLLGVIGLIVMAVALAYLMWRFVEEPAREWMRSKIGVKKLPVEEAAMGVDIDHTKSETTDTGATSSEASAGETEAETTTHDDGAEAESVTRQADT